jgi:hypothetical protein
MIGRLAVVLAMLAVTACSTRNGGEGLLAIAGAGASDRPDEFLVLPRKPLELPPDLAALPAPTPGQGNLADLTPIPDARVALGGNPEGGTVGPGDAALVAATRRYGVAGGIRQVLAAEDAEWRRTNRGRLLERLLLRNDESVVYRRVILEPYPELVRLRQQGVRTPAAPPGE